MIKQSNNKTFFTKATDSLGAVSSGVDTRTGIYSVNLNIANLVGNRGLGPHFDFTLKYSPLNVHNYGFGTGFGIGVTVYDRQNKTLTLYTGEQFKILDENTSGNQVKVLGPKTKIFKFQKEHQNEYIVTFKDGRKEYLAGRSDDHDLKVTHRIIDDSLMELCLEWDFSWAKGMRLVSVSNKNDKESPLINIEYTEESKSTIHLYKNTKEYYGTELNFFNGFLKKLKRYSDIDAVEGGNIQEWTFEYTQDSNSQLHKFWGPWLNKVVYPGGMTEQATYDNVNGHAFPTSTNSPAKFPNLPYVTVFERFLDNNKSILAGKSTYQFSRSNFLGGNSNPDRVIEDNSNGLEYIFCLWETEPNYTYDCIETKLIDSANQDINIVITSTYNIFHLLITEECKDGSTLVKNDIEYYSATNVDPTSQNENFRMPLKTIQTFTNRDKQQKTILTETHYDSYENLTAKKVINLADNSTIEPSVAIAYYSDAESETINDIILNCPADPNGFVKYIKSITITPIGTDKKEEVKTQYFSYSYINKDSKVIVKSNETQINSLHQLSTNFFYDSSVDNFGRLAMEDFTLILLSKNKTYKSHKSYNYKNDVGNYTQITTNVSHDSKKTINENCISNQTGRIIKETSSDGKETIFKYDVFGRLINKTSQTVDSLPLEDKYVYYTNIADKYPLKTLHVFPDGSRELLEQDSLGRISQRRINTDRDGNEFFVSWPVMEQYEYDFLCRKIKHTKFDYLLSGNTSKKIMEKNVIYKYDIWGNECQRITNTGLEENILFDPVTNTNVYTFKDGKGNFLLGDIIENLNHTNVRLKMTQSDFDKKESIETQLIRDGWNRVIKTVNANGISSQQEYDCYDRLVKEIRHNKNQLRYSYPGFSKENHINTIELLICSDSIETKDVTDPPSSTPITLGKKRYDGLGRLIEYKAFGRRWSYEYASDNLIAPGLIVDPSGTVKVLDYAYIQEANVKEVYISQGNSKKSIGLFRYNKITGAILEGITEKCTVKTTYDESGYMKSDALSFEGDNANNFEYEWSLGGLLCSVNNAQGLKQEHYFDAFGRIIRVIGSKVDMLYEYDELSRVTSHIVLKKDSTHRIETSIRYDAFGRENYRKMQDTLHTVNTRVIKQKWDKMNRLTDKEIFAIENDIEVHILTEKYKYNNDGAIVDYHCYKKDSMGLQHIPTDIFGNPIYHESFEYDDFGNVVKNVRSFLPPEEGGTAPQHINTAIFSYDKNEPTRLIEKTNTHKSYPSSVKLQYDLNGNVTAVGNDQIVYDDMGRLNSINDQKYYYDALDRLVKAGNSTRFYSFDKLWGEKGKDKNRASIFVGHFGAEMNNDNTILTAFDGKNSCIYTAQDDKGEWLSYSVYGESSASNTLKSFFGFNGEHRDCTLDAYAPGSGYRFYSPSLMRFINPDSPFNSPIGAGGINPYAYCLGDPVNNADPTGQISWQGWVSMAAGGIGLMMTLLTGGLGIAAASGILATSIAVGATAASIISGVTAIVGTAISGVSPDATRILRWVSLGTGLLSFSTGAAGMAQGVYKAIRELGLRTTLATLGTTSRIGLALNVTSYTTATISYGTSLIKRVLDHTALAQSGFSTAIGNISFGTGLVSDAASISHFALSKAMPRSFSWDVPQSTTMDEISLRSLTPGANSLDPNTMGSYGHFSEVFIPQINNFFLHIPLQARP